MCTITGMFKKVPTFVYLIYHPALYVSVVSDFLAHFSYIFHSV